MQVWKRRLVVLAAIGAGSVGLVTTSAGAQTSPPTSVPTFTIPEVPEFPTIPTFTIPPPPTMPPSTISPPTSPPPTMPPPSFTIPTITIPPPPTMPPSTISPPTSPPPTMPPTSIPSPTVPDLDEIVEAFLDELQNIFLEGEPGFEQLQQILQELLDRF